MASDGRGSPPADREDGDGPHPRSATVFLRQSWPGRTHPHQSRWPSTIFSLSWSRRPRQAASPLELSEMKLLEVSVHILRFLLPQWLDVGGAMTCVCEVVVDHWG